MSAKEIPKQNNMEKFEIREQSKNKTEAKWKYKVRTTETAICHQPKSTISPATESNGWFGTAAGSWVVTTSASVVPLICLFTEQQTGLFAEDGGREQS